VRLSDLGLRPGRLDRGPANAITDVPGVRVGQAATRQGGSAVGVTAIVPYGAAPRPVATGLYAVDGGGGMTSLGVVEDFGTASAPVVLASAAAVGAAYEALIDLGLSVDAGLPVGAGWPPLVVPVDDAVTSDPAVQHDLARPALVHAALAAAATSAPAEGAVGIGAGLAAFGGRGGVGTASRRAAGGQAVVGALVAVNGGEPTSLSVDGVPVGAHLRAPPLPASAARTFAAALVTDAPLMPRQLDRLAGRAVLGLARLGLYDADTREGLVLAQSTTGLVSETAGATPAPTGVAAPGAARPLKEAGLERVGLAGEDDLPGLFRAAAEACEEAALNGLVAAAAAGPAVARDGRHLPPLPLDGWPAAVRRLRPQEG